MHLHDLYPVQGTYKPGEPISLVAEVYSAQATQATFRIRLVHLAEIAETITLTISIRTGKHSYPFSLDVPENAPRGYGVEVDLVDRKGAVTGSATTAFDVLNTWLEFPRYGFLTDFYADRPEMETTIQWLARNHVNVLQFYDWHYRHDQFLPPAPIYQDPLKRDLSLETVKGLLTLAHFHGIAGMSYFAVYAASLAFWEKHQDWGLFDEHGQPIHFEDFLAIMDPSPNGPWVTHLLDQCEWTLNLLPFDGLHVDQYGEPKVGFDQDENEVDLPAAFQDFVVELKARFSQFGVTFNAVANWPIDALAAAPLDFAYIEIWPPTPYYKDLLEIILGARNKFGGKPVVIALYIPANRKENIRLSDAFIFASGGCRIEFGENQRLLTDPYFPKHQAIPTELSVVLRRYYDFAVRYGDFVGPAALNVDDFDIELPEGVWSVIRKSQECYVIHLINTNGLDELKWVDPHNAPATLESFKIQLAMSHQVQHVLWATPDMDWISLSPAEWHEEQDCLVVEVPSLEYWTMVVIQL